MVLGLTIFSTPQRRDTIGQILVALRTNFITMMSTQRSKRNVLGHHTRLWGLCSTLVFLLKRGVLQLPLPITVVTLFTNCLYCHSLHIIDACIIRWGIRHFLEVIFGGHRGQQFGTLYGTISHGIDGNLHGQVVRGTIRLGPRGMSTPYTM